MTKSGTPRAFSASQSSRESHRVRIATGLLAIRLEHGSLADLAGATGVSTARWKQWESPDHAASVSLADVATLAEVYPVAAQAIARLLTDAMGQVLAPAPVATTVTDDRKQGSRMAQTAARTYADLLEALDDGLIDRAEAMRLEGPLAELEALVAGIKARVGDAKAAGVDAERGGGLRVAK